MRALRSFLVTACLIVAGFGAGAVASQAAELQKVSFGSINATSDAGVFLADDYGFFRDEGISVEVRVISDAPAIIAAVATDQLDVAGMSVTPGLFTAVQQGMNLRIVGDKQSFSPGFGSTKLLVRKAMVKATEAETVAGLKGKTVAVNSKGAITFYFMERLLAKYGLTLKDVNLVEISYPNIAIALVRGSVDAGSLIEPFVSESLQSGQTQLLGGDLLEFVPGGSMSVTPLVYSETFREKRPLAEAFMRAYIKGVRVYNDAFVKGKDKDKVIDIIARRTGVTSAIVREGFPPGLDPDQIINVNAFTTIERFYADQGLIRNPQGNSDGIVDLSFAKAAVAALGTYK